MRNRVSFSHTQKFICPGGRRAAAASLLVSTIAAVGNGSAHAGLGGGGGAVHSWTGSVNTSWHNSGNWNTGQVPLAGDSAIVLGGANNVFLFNDTAAIHSLFVGGARTVSNNGHVLNVTNGAATTTVTGLDSALFTQRRFTDLAEFEQCLARLASRGIDSRGLEARGLLQANLYVSRPADDVRRASLDDIVTISVGRNRPTGPRYVHVPTLEGQQVALEP